ncbi:MAG: hypothetical protein DI498_07575 [Paracoccus denitrificans]|nr:MAG: hypothetical protein DI498_07575 [Paracoccus denitrificans]PZO84389.1 MAG: hypothetical protein DI633_07575 [Paracoccus denitrificans]
MRLTGFNFLQTCLLLVAVALFATQVLAADHPAEDPPPDFPSPQYIDSAGCVFVRADGAWTPRLLRDGDNVCGYPPSVTAEVSPKLTRADLTQKLSEAVVTGLNDEELNSSPPEEARVEIADRIREAPRIRQMIASRPTGVVSSNAGNRRLCDLLGGATTGVAGFGASAKGFCNLAPLDLLGLTDAATLSPPDRVVIAEVPKRAVNIRQSGQSGAVKTDSKPVKSRSAKSEGEVKPWHRYVAIGGWRDAAGADQTAARVRATGLTAGRIKGGARNTGIQVVAGPFEGREGVVRAIQILRGAGFTGLVPR